MRGTRCLHPPGAGQFYTGLITGEVCHRVGAFYWLRAGARQQLGRRGERGGGMERRRLYLFTGNPNPTSVPDQAGWTLRTRGEGRREGGERGEGVVNALTRHQAGDSIPTRLWKRFRTCTDTWNAGGHVLPGNDAARGRGCSDTLPPKEGLVEHFQVRVKPGSLNYIFLFMSLMYAVQHHIIWNYDSISLNMSTQHTFSSNLHFQTVLS